MTITLLRKSRGTGPGVVAAGEAEVELVIEITAERLLELWDEAEINTLIDGLIAEESDVKAFYKRRLDDEPWGRPEDDETEPGFEVDRRNLDEALAELRLGHVAEALHRLTIALGRDFIDLEDRVRQAAREGKL
ncbi:hypothetical protein SAMN05519104_6698 [Rhizobiales bacterium GAS188]|nr:hypothetical protein SAMN05519104_6698 [Rhizobiales bacterium GAS188]